MDSNRKRGRKRYAEEKLIDKGGANTENQDSQKKDDVVLVLDTKDSRKDMIIDTQNEEVRFRKVTYWVEN